jgi:hypothetical protein
VNPPDQPQCRNCHRHLLPADVESVRVTMTAERVKAIGLSRILWILVLVATVILCVMEIHIENF